MGLGVSGIGSSVPGMVPDTICDFLKEEHKTKMSKMCEPLPPTSPNFSVPSARENLFFVAVFFFFNFYLKEMKISCGLSWPTFCCSHRIPEAEFKNKKFYLCGSEGFRCNQQAWLLGRDYAGCFNNVEEKLPCAEGVNHMGVLALQQLF